MLGADPESLRPLRPAWIAEKVRKAFHVLDPFVDHPIVDLLDLALPDRLGDGGAGLGTHIAIVDLVAALVGLPQVRPQHLVQGLLEQSPGCIRPMQDAGVE